MKVTEAVLVWLAFGLLSLLAVLAIASGQWLGVLVGVGIGWVAVVLMVKS